MRVLVISPLPLLPQSHGARVRTYRLAAGLARAGAQVDVLYPWTPGQPLRAARVDGMTLHPQAFALNPLPRLVSERRVPWQVLLSRQPFALGPRRRLRAFDGHDIAQFELCANARWMGTAPRRAKVVYSAHNVELDFYARLREPDGRWWGRMLSAVKGLEARAVRSSDLVIGTTSDDGVRLTQLYGPPRRFEVIPHGHPGASLNGTREAVRAQTRSALGLGPADRAVLFVGGPGHHNRRAVRFLEDELLPRLDGRARLVLAGECAPRFNSNGRIIRLGFVEDLEPVFAASDVAVNPIAAAAGQSLKVAEYLGAGLPVVATPAGALGSQRASKAVRVAELRDFPAAVEAAADEPHPLQPAPAHATWEELGRRLYRAYEELLRT